MNSIEEEKVEKYLAEVADRLFDTQAFIQALKRGITIDKNVLVRNGRSFAYQQGILDVIEEFDAYATGKRSFQEDTKQILSEMAKESEKLAEKDQSSRAIYG